MPPATSPTSQRHRAAPGQRIPVHARSGTGDAVDDTTDDTASVAAHIARRVGDARRNTGLTLTALARSKGISPAYLSQIESGLANPTLRTLVQIASALGTDVAHLLGAPDETTTGAFRPYLSGAPLAARDHLGSGIWDLTAPGSRRLAARLVQGEPVGHTAPIRHAGEELLVVLNGRCKLHVDDAVYQLETGDACHFSATGLHHISATTADLTMCVVLSEE